MTQNKKKTNILINKNLMNFFHYYIYKKRRYNNYNIITHNAAVCTQHSSADPSGDFDLSSGSSIIWFFKIYFYVYIGIYYYISIDSVWHILFKCNVYNIFILIIITMALDVFASPHVYTRYINTIIIDGEAEDIVGREEKENRYV